LIVDITTYNFKTGQDVERFMGDCFWICGISGHPKSIELYERAWSMGWEGGPMDVLLVLWDLCEMEGL
jgi:hypothetical protein